MICPDENCHVASSRCTNRVTGGLKSDAHVASRGSEEQPDGVIEEVTFWVGFVLQVGIMKEEGTEKMAGPPL